MILASLLLCLFNAHRHALQNPFELSACAFELFAFELYAFERSAFERVALERFAFELSAFELSASATVTFQDSRVLGIMIMSFVFEI